jgi:dienelactone hydrolase
MAYDPFVRGPYPVGARSADVTDPSRDGRKLDVEVWYPAAAEARDADARAGRHPLVLFSHASGGHRRQSTFLCTHLASHGYVVAAADHAGNTAADVADRGRRVAAGAPFTPDEVDALVRAFIADRVPDLRLLADRLLAGAADVADLIDPQRIGLIGWSFGGWAVLATLETDARFGAVVALAPAGNSKPLPGIIPATLAFAWKREVPALYLVAERDRFTPVAGQLELFARTPSRKAMFILREADHGHFADDIAEPGLCPPERAHLFTRGLALAHLDAVLKEDRAAARFMARDAASALRDRSIDAFEHQPAESIR